MERMLSFYLALGVQLKSVQVVCTTPASSWTGDGDADVMKSCSEMWRRARASEVRWSGGQLSESVQLGLQDSNLNVLTLFCSL